jgi:ATP-dependent DNA helicase RecG
MMNAPAPLTSRSELLRLIRGGEDTYLELKVKLSNSEKIAQGIIALANTDGGTIIFGVNDQLRIEGVPNPEAVQEDLVRICREEVVPPLVPVIDCITFDSGRQVVAIDVEGRRRPYRTREGRFYLRFGAEKREVTREELSAWLDEIRPLGYENVPFSEFGERDFDDALLWGYAGEFEADFASKNLYQTGEFLKKELLLAVGGADEFVPTLAGILLFARSERIAEALPRFRFVVTRYSGENAVSEIVERVEINGSLLHVYDACLAFIERYCNLLKSKPSRKEIALAQGPVKGRTNYHIYSIREAVANAIMHRDLAVRDLVAKISIFDSSIEIVNPRRTLGFVPPASRAIRYGITQRLNPQIAAIFSKREYGTSVPTGGIPMLLRSSHHFSGKKPEIGTSGDEFRLKIYGF